MREFIMHIDETRKITNKASIGVHFSGLKQGKYRVRIDAYKKRSLDQNGYYWSTCVPLIRQALINEGWNGIHTNEQAHDVIKGELLQVDMINEKTGEIRKRTRSTTELSTIEFTTFLENLWMWAEEWLNIYIPRPNEQMPMFLETFKD